MRLVSFLSDFNQKDEWVAVVKNIIKERAPEAEILDISHQISSFNILKGALVLQRAVKHIKADVHLAVVDPGVGTRRKSLCIESKRGDRFVGPDNGLLIPASEELGLKRAVELTNKKYFLKQVSPTFHARDIFAPVAASLIKGTDLNSLGKEINPLMLKRIDIKKPVKSKGKLLLEVLENDNFGTARLNVSAHQLAKYSLNAGKTYSIEIDNQPYQLRFVKSFGELEPLEAGLIIDSSNQLSIYLNKGSAAEILCLKPGKEVVLVLGA